MEKCCKTCKWFDFGECINKDFKKLFNNAPEYNFNSLIEGDLSDYIRESGKCYEIAKIIIDELENNEFIKKTKKLESYKKQVDDYVLENNFIEVVDEIISDFVIDRLSDIQNIVEVEQNFMCKYWE